MNGCTAVQSLKKNKIAPDVRPDAVTFRNVDFLRLEPVVRWHELDYEYVFVQLGAQPPELCLALCSVRILVAD